MAAQHQIVAVAYTDAQFNDAQPCVAASLKIVGYISLLTVKAQPDHHAPRTAPLNIALAEGSGKRESSVVEDVITVKVDGLLFYLTFLYIRDNVARSGMPPISF